MRSISSLCVLLGFVLILTISSTSSAEPNTFTAESSKYLNAVREFADNVLKYGRDTYGPNHTPLFVDGLNIHTHEPVKWISPKGGDPLTATETEEWILSNFASQQTLLRTLDGLSVLTGDPKYRNAAEQAVRYAFDNLRAANGLFYWGECATYVAQADTTYAIRDMHCLKTTYPYYELMWRVDRNATRKFIDAFWSAHVLDWSNLDFCRISVPYTSEFETSWEHEFRGGPTFFSSKRSWGNGFFHTGTSLVYGAATIYQLSGEKPPLVWGKRLMQRFMDTRNPKTGITAHLYNRQPQRMFPNEQMKEYFVDPYTTVFPHIPFEKMRRQNFRYCGENWQPLPWISLFLTGHMLDEDGEELTQWALEEMGAWAKSSYRASDNSFVPILTDGTSIEGVILQTDCGLGAKGDIATALFASPAFFWLYTTAYQMTSDKLMWQMARDIAIGNGFGDIGQTPRHIPQLQSRTDCSDVYGLLGFLDLYRKTNKPEFLTIARRITDNIIKTKFSQGFFIPSYAHVYARFDCVEPLALLHLVALLDESDASLPQVWPTSAKFGAGSYRYKDGYPTDRDLIYRITDSSQVPWSLAEAAHIGDINKLKLLLASGLDVDGQDDNWQRTPLQRAVIRGHMDVVKFLLAHGARVDCINPHGPSQTPLSYAVQYRHRDIVELLIDQGADVNAKNDDGRSLIDVARRTGNSGIVELIQVAQAETSIHAAASQGMSAKVKSLLEDGADVNTKDDQGVTPLHLAAQGGHKEVVELLLSKNADVNAKNNKGYTPLYSAIWINDANMVALLASKNADVNYSPEDDYPPLHYAIWEENLDIVKVLVKNGAKFDAKDEDGWTAFHYAADEANREIVELFVANGADVSSIHRAACVGDLSRIQSLIEQGTAADEKDEAGWTPLYWACSMGQEAVGEFLLSKGARVDAKTGGENIPLQAACYSGEFRLVELLVSNGADVNAKDNFGSTPLHGAATKGSRQIVELLITEGADVNAKNRNNWTPLHRAAIGGHKDVVKILISYGADTAVKDSRGRTPLQWATQRGHTEILDLLHKQIQVRDVAVTKVSAAPSCVQGKTARIVVSLDNHGDRSESCTVKLTADTNGKEIARQSTTIHSKQHTASEVDLIFHGEPGNDNYFGDYTAVGGDVNGDGYNDILLSSSGYPNSGLKGRGRAYLYYGGSNMDTVADKIFTGENDGDLFSDGIHSIADLNNDNYADLLIGATEYGGKGRLYIFYGGTDMDDVADIIIDSPDTNDRYFGYKPSVGDVNGDGHKDLCITALKYNNGVGRVYLYYGPIASDTTVDKRFTGKNTNDWFGHTVVLDGDIDNDGCDDICVASRERGCVYLYWGAEGSSLDEVCDLTFIGETGLGCGLDVHDIDNDHHADLIIGSQGQKTRKGAWLYWGAPRSEFDNLADITFLGEKRSDNFGNYISVGRADSDPYPEIMINAWYWGGAIGRSYLYHGASQRSMDNDPDHIFTGEIPHWGSGQTHLVDVNNDGYADVLGGSCTYNDKQGRALLWYGPFTSTKDVTFNWDTTNASLGKHTLEVEIMPVPGERNVENNAKTLTIQIKEPMK